MVGCSFRKMIDARKEARAAAAVFSRIKLETTNDETRSFAEGLEHLAKAIQAIADPEMAKLAMDWP